MDKKTAIARTILPAGKTDLKTSEQNPVKVKTASGIEAASPAFDENRLVNQSEQTSEAKGTCSEVKGQPDKGSFQLREESGQLREESEQIREESEQLRGESGQLRGESEQSCGGSGQFRDECGQFHGGSEQFRGESQQFQDGSQQFQDGSEQFQNGSEQLRGESEQLRGGSEQFRGGSGELQGGSESRENQPSSDAGLEGNGANSAKNEVFMNDQGPVQLKEMLSSAITLPEAGSKLQGEGIKGELREGESDLHSLLSNDAAGDVKASIKLKDNDVVIPLNEEVRFVFSDENTISKIIIKGIVNKRYLQRQRVQAKTTPLKLEGPLRKINQYVRVSKRDYFLLLVGAMSALKVRRNEVKYTAQFVNILLYTLANHSFTYKEIMGNFGVSRSGLIRIVSRMKSLGWIGYNSARSKRYLYLTERGMGFIKEAVEKRETGDGVTG